MVRSIAGSGLAAAAIGLIAGTGVATAASEIIATQLFGVEPRDLLVYVASVTGLLLLALLSTLIPAQRAARLNPVESLRLD